MEIAFTGKTAIVTGASKGIGRFVAKKLSECGAKVYALARDINQLQTLQKESKNIEIYEVDLTNWAKTEEVLKIIGNIDLLVNNAGLAILEPLEKASESSITALFDINVKALIHLTQYVAKNLKERNVAGAIVNVSSQASMAGLLDHSVYCATKGAVDAFTRAAAVELGPYNIRVNAVNPTVIMTDMGKLGWSDPNKAEPMLRKIPLRRFGEVQEVVDAILYLLSDKASMINGTCLPVDGGYLAS